jgi:adenylosuccinate lyase
MPHKSNPVRVEQICGLARVVRGYVGPALEDIALWQHRDISHSSVERMILPDASALSEYLCNATAGVVTDLVVNDKAMLANLHRAGDRAASSRELSRRLDGGVPRRVAVQDVRDLGALSETPRGGADQRALATAVDEVRTSRELNTCFERIDELRRRYRDHLAQGHP